MKKIISNQKLPLIVAFLPFLINLVYYHQLPDKVAIHFDQNFQADNFISKNIFIFFPMMMVALQLCLFYIEEKQWESTTSPSYPLDYSLHQYLGDSCQH